MNDRARRQSNLRDVSDPRARHRAGTPPPSNLDVEAVVLSDIMCSHSVDVVRGILRDRSDFYSDANGAIYAAACDLADEGSRVDVETICARFAAKGAGDDFLRYVRQVELRTPATANVASHARIVRQLAGRRRMIAVIDVCLAEGYIDDAPHDEWLASVGDRIAKVAAEESSPASTTTLGQAAAQVYADASKPPEERAQKPGLRVGLEEVDARMVGGVAGLTVVLGERGGGKSALALTIAVHLSRLDDRNVVPIFSFEMSAEEYATRALAHLARIDGGKLVGDATNGITQSEWGRVSGASEEASRLASPMYCDPKRATIGFIRSALRTKHREARREGRRMPAAIVDCLQIVGARRELPHDANREQEVSHVARELKVLTEELDVAIFLLSHMNKSGGARESAAVEYHADNVWRMKLGKHSDRGYGPLRRDDTLRITKQRRGGGDENCPLTFYPAESRFE